MKLRKSDIVIILLFLFSLVFWGYKKWSATDLHDLTKNKSIIFWEAGDTLQLGKLSIGKEYTFNKKFYNTGDNLLHVQNIKITCGCTQADFSSLEIKPLDSCNISGKINVNYTAKNFTKILFNANTDSIKNALVVYFEGIK
ncbi:MAG: hypothetical protein RIR12_921 [Bacteroidota bacterium]|jgi:hypothetical protein